MSKVKSNLIKLFSCLFAVCLGVAIFAMPTSNEVNAEDTSSFEVVGTSVRNEAVDNLQISGLKYTINVTSAWFESHNAERYSFGTLIFPTANIEAFSTSLSPSQNWRNENVDGVNIIAFQNQAKKDVDSGITYEATIQFDDDTLVKAIIEKTDCSEDEALTQLASVREGIFEKPFTAVPYAIFNGVVKYATPYSTTMHETAVKTYAKGVVENNKEHKDIAEIYLGTLNVVERTAVISDTEKVLVIEGEGYTVEQNSLIVANGSLLKNDNGFTLDTNGEATLSGEFTASKTETQKICIFNGTDVVIATTFVANNVIRTPEQLTYFFDNNLWVEGETIFEEITVLGNDIDMTGITIPQTTNVPTFNGCFDGRGHVISNMTKVMTKSEGLFGDTAQSIDNTIKNFALDDFTVSGTTVNQGVLGNSIRKSCVVENIYINYTAESAHQQLFLYTRAGTMRNVVIEAPYDLNYDWATYIDKKNTTSSALSYITRMFAPNNKYISTDIQNVQVISQAPLYVHANDNLTDATYTLNEETGKYEVSDWGSYMVYGENETELKYDFDYYYRAENDPEKPGLGLVKGKATVQDTVISDTGELGTDRYVGKTRIWKGVKRYDTTSDMLADTNNKTNIEALVATGMWKLEEGRLVWANSKNITKPTEYIGGDYDASQNKLISTALNGEKVQKVTVNGVELSLQDGEYTVDENGYLAEIYAKTSPTDTTKNGITYKYNNNNGLIQDELIIETTNTKYILINVNYWTKIIYDAKDLKEALDINYTTNQEKGESGNGIVYNTHTDGVKYVYNVGMYKLGSDIDMYDYEKDTYVQLDYTGLTPAYNKMTGGFSGTFDGDGHIIDNFKPTVNGLFGTFATSGSGLDSANGDQGARVKNIAFTNVMSEVQNSPDSTTTIEICPVIISTIYQSEESQQHISNVYVSYSKNATDMYGLVYRPTVKLYMNNVYVVNEQGYHAIDSSKVNQYYFEDGTRLDSNKYYRNIFGTNSTKTTSAFYTSSLFGDVRYASDITTSYINNVIVASPNIISYNFSGVQYSYQYLYKVDYINRKVFFADSSLKEKENWFKIGRYYYGNSTESYLCSVCGNYYTSAACSLGCEDATFTLRKKNNNNTYKRFGYAGNETTGNVPFVEDIAPMLLAEMESPAIVDGVLLNHFANAGTSKIHAYACNVCGSYASFFNGSKCYDPECEGTNTVSTDSEKYERDDYSGIWSGALGYEWKFPDLQSYSGSAKFSNSNSIVRFMGAYRYDTIAEMQQAVVKGSVSLDTFATNKYWKVTEDGKLYWASLYSAQA